VFYFSSSRRHTRSKRDWSSDVCSSDLIKKYQEDLFIYPAASKNHHAYMSGLAHHIVTMLKTAKSLCFIYPELNKDLLYAGIILRSEERRVGIECRYEWWMEK